MPKSLIVTWPAVGARALRASRSAHERREWARCARERITSARQSEAAAGGGRLTSMRWCRTSCMQARRCALRLQSRQSSGVGPTRRGCEPHTDPTWFCGCFPVPLTVRTLWAATTIEYPGAVEHAQTAIGKALLLGFAARLGATSCQPDSAASHRAGG